MPRSGVKPIFEPTSVALYGASPQEDSLGNILLRNMQRAGYKGRIYRINPKYKKIGTHKCYPSLKAVRKSVDLAIIATPAATVPDIISDCGEMEVPGAIVISAGFGEAGEQGRALERLTAKRARRAGLRFLGPNCLGVIRPSIGFNATFSHSDANDGRIALVSQSGALCTAILDWAGPNNVGFSAVISTGTSADVGFGEILDYLIADSQTDSIMLYIEGVHQTRHFMSALRAAARAKPVVVMKSGRYEAGSRAAVSHTGAIVGSDDVFDAALRRAGVLRVSTFANFFSAAATLDSGVRSHGNRLAIVTNAGGPGVMAADECVARNVTLAEFGKETIERLDRALPPAWSHANPVDVLGDASPERYQEALLACIDDPGVDAVLAILTPQALSAPGEVAEKLTVIASGAKKPIFTCWMGEPAVASSHALFRANNIPSYRTPEAAVRAFAAIEMYRDSQQQLLQVPEPLTRQSAPDVDSAKLIIESALDERRKVLTLAESKALLSAFKVPVVKSIPAHDASDAVLLATEIGFPVAMKILSPDITHKTDVGGVQLGIATAREVRGAFQKMIDGVKERCPDAKIQGVAIEPMWKRRNGRELMIGVVSDEVFGPAISFGLGGTMVEVLRDRAVALPPLNRFLARRLISNTRAAKYLEAFRGTPAADMRALEDLLLRVSEMVCELRWLKELDLNPVIADDKGVVVVDARIVVDRVTSAAAGYDHMAIHPYPTDLVQQWELTDGRSITIRPIRPEDALIERDFVNGLSEQSRYFRFMYALQEITPAMLSRFTQIDYDREMALIATIEEDDAEKQIGVARYVTMLGEESCEFAIVVADNWQGRGLATRLLKTLIEIARDRRLRFMEGVVLRENHNMLSLAESIGFDLSPDSDDPDVVNLMLRL